MEEQERQETYFHGSKEEWLSVIPESSVNKIIEILDIDLDKEALWNDIAIIIRTWGKPAESKLGINLQSVIKKSESIDNTLSKTLRLLGELSYNQIFENGTITKQSEIAHKIRENSKRKQSDKNRNVSDLYIKQEYEKNGEWGKYCIFDYELSETINALEKMHAYVRDAKNDFIDNITGQGEGTITNTRQNNLVFEICKIYNKYTGKTPTFSYSGSESSNPKKVYGKIIKILQIIIEHTNFTRETSDVALEKRLRELRENPEYRWLWYKNNHDSNR